MAAAIDEKSALCIPFILKRLEEHRRTSRQPFFIGLNGVQGAGKTTLVNTLLGTLSSPPYSLPTLALSIDDLYLPHDALTALAAAHPTNPLLQHRGEPSTHDIPLGTRIFAALRNRESNIRIPAYDKSLHAGKGDRAPEDTWAVVNRNNEPKIDVVLFEGWCVGFRKLTDAALAARHAEVRKCTVVDDDVRAQGRLARHRIEDVAVVNDALGEYDVLTDALHAFISIDAADTGYVYDWRLQQEAALRRDKGEANGMTDEQVVQFVNGYYPAYELYLDGLRAGVLKGAAGRQLRLVVDKDRRVQSSSVI